MAHVSIAALFAVLSFQNFLAGRGCAFLSPKWGLAGEVQAAVLCPVVHVDGLP